MASANPDITDVRNEGDKGEDTGADQEGRVMVKQTGLLSAIFAWTQQEML